jgi:hypothetical protein
MVSQVKRVNVTLIKENLKTDNWDGRIIMNTELSFSQKTQGNEVHYSTQNKKQYYTYLLCN